MTAIVTARGKLHEDPEVRESKKGEYITFRCGVYQGGDDDDTKYANYSVIAFGEYNVEAIQKFKKDDMITFIGRLQLSVYEGKKGNYVNANTTLLQLLNPKFDNDKKPAKKSRRIDDDDEEDEKPKKKRKKEDDDDDYPF